MSAKILNELNKKTVASQLPAISYHYLCRGKGGASYFANIYFPIYDVDVNELFERYLLLVFVEGLIYKADEDVEAAQVQKLHKTANSIWNPTKEIILSLLTELNINHPKIEYYLEELGEYWELENKLMTADTLVIEDIIRAQKLRTSDGRILHSILVQLLGKYLDEKILDLILPLEVWAEFETDFVEYKKDVGEGNYNAYHMFEKFYGDEALHYYKTELEYHENLFKERLKQFPSNEQEKFCKIYEFCKKDLSYLTNYYYG